jgi:soluble lytic murein transglycosylase-like protein
MHKSFLNCLVRMVWGLFILCFSANGWTQPSTLSDCLFSSRINSPACTSQIVRLESQYAFVPQLALEARIDPALILAVIAVESSYAQLKLTDRGGIGPMQITPVAARDMGIDDLTYLLSDTVNVQTGTRYLQKMMQRFGDWRLALAAYNAGPGAVTRHKGVPPYRETQVYVKQVMWWYLTLKSV